MKRALAGLVAGLTLLAGAAIAEPAAAPDQPLTDAAQEARAQHLFEEVRCVVCQHESIADSPAGLAADMRRLVREEIASGSSDDAVRADLVRRWGDFILFKPPVIPATWLLWFGPVGIVLLIGALFVLRARRRPTPEAPLSPAEEARLSELLASRDVRPDPDASSPHDRREAGPTIVPPPD
ncbi:cytochrome c-type biogenesis protein CcmH [soil metagenome]